MDNPPTDDMDFLVEYLHLGLSNRDGQASLRSWFTQFESARLAWQIDRCQRLWRLLVGQPLDRLTQARARMMRGLLWANLGDWPAAEGCQFTPYTTPMTNSKGTPVNYTHTTPLYG